MIRECLLTVCALLMLVGCLNVDNPTSELESNCYNWPGEEFSTTNRATISTIEQGSRAIDFTLNDPGGEKHTLSFLLNTKPVLMVFGSFT